MIKTLACIFMLVDHIGFAFFPEMVMFRVVGRLAFPLFAYQVSTGLLHTTDTGRYFVRLFSFGLLSQLPYMALFQTTRLCILFTFSFAVLLVYFFQNKKYLALPFIFIAFAALDSIYGVAYGLYGLFSVIGFYYLRNNFKHFAGSVVSVPFFTLLTFFALKDFGTIQVFSLYAVPFFFIRRDFVFIHRYFFYGFYPVHLALIWFCTTVIQSDSVQQLYNTLGL
ncbi:MAG: hypothetical protein D3920_00855 [Candidatus Electrothrix sp. AW2]|nr:hypothetical protein [Candidatus Electrothrix gigas]